MTASPGERLADLPPSAKLVFIVLTERGRLTQQELCEETLLVPRTVRYGLSRLSERGLVTERISFRDARKRVYSLSDAGDAVARSGPW